MRLSFDRIANATVGVGVIEGAIGDQVLPCDIDKEQLQVWVAEQVERFTASLEKVDTGLLMDINLGLEQVLMKR